MHLNNLGRLIESVWLQTAEVRANVVLDKYVVMPNHFHGILFITDAVGASRWLAPNYPAMQSRATHRVAPTILKPGTVGAIVGQFKSIVTKEAHSQYTYLSPIWQRNYHEHVIRDERDLYAKRKYIEENPAKWEMDEYYSS